MDPAEYEAWYHTPRGAWIGEVEFGLMHRMLRPRAGTTLLDVGSGTGYFSRRFAAAGLAVTGLDPDPAVIHYAHGLGGGVRYVRGVATALPMGDASHDYVVAITSLCFVVDPERALQEMWRVARHAVFLGLLNRHSLLYRQKHGRGAYRGARWDTAREVRAWVGALNPAPHPVARSAVFLPAGNWIARATERLLPGLLPCGGFLAMCLPKPRRTPLA